MRYLIFISFFIAVNTVSGQTSYLVFQVKGKAWMATDKTHKQLKIGQLITDNGSIHVNKRSSVILICENYSTVTLDHDQDYQLSQYSSSCKQKSNSVTADYFKFMWDELTSSETVSEKDRQKYMSTNVGAVERGVPDILIDKALDTINVFEDSMIIRWKTPLADKDILFVMCDSAEKGQVLFSTSGTSRSVSMDTIRKYTGNNKIIYWNLKEYGKENGPRKFIRFWTREEVNDYLEILDKASTLDRYSPEWYYMLGFCLEEDHFFGLAKVHYQIAAQMKPDDKRYASTLADIKARYFN
jgi:hypothetical protein